LPATATPGPTVILCKTGWTKHSVRVRQELRSDQLTTENIGPPPERYRSVGAQIANGNTRELGQTAKCLFLIGSHIFRLKFEIAEKRN
jgi:hypothetical protein